MGDSAGHDIEMAQNATDEIDSTETTNKLVQEIAENIFNLNQKEDDETYYIELEKLGQVFTKHIGKMAQKTGDQVDYTETLKKLVQVFTENIVKMVCPFILAISVMDVPKMKIRKAGLRYSIPSLAGVTLEIGIFAFFLVSCLLSNWYSRILFRLCSTRNLFRFSIGFIHLCGILLMALAFCILYLVTDGHYKILMYVLAAAASSAVLILGWKNDWYRQECNTSAHRNNGDKLEAAVDFSAAVTFVLFTGLGVLALGGQYTTIQLQGQKLTLLAFSFALSFVTCIVGVYSMLLDTVHPVHNMADIWHYVDVLNYILAGALAVIVMLITTATLSLGAAGNVFVLSVILPVGAWALAVFGGGAEQQPGGGEKVKPASLDLTKVTFAGFLAISVNSLSKNKKPLSVHSSAFWFIFFTASAVSNGLGWRIFTHEKEPSPAQFKASCVASFFARLYIAASVIPFAIMAWSAL